MKLFQYSGNCHPNKIQRVSTRPSISLIVFLLAALLINPSIANAERSLDNLIKQADKSFHTDNYRRAVESYKKAAELDPKNADIFYKLGFSYGELEEWDKGLDAYKKATSIRTLAPFDTPLKKSKAKKHFNKGNDYQMGEKYELAIKEYRQVQKLEPKNPTGFYQLGWAYYFKKDVGNAIHYLKKTMKVMPDFTGIGALGTIHYRNKDCQKAIFYTKSWLLFDPTTKHKSDALKRIKECEKHLNAGKFMEFIE